MSEGDVVGCWIMEEKIGEGATCKVRRAVHVRTLRHVAAKIIAKSDVNINPALRIRIRREIALMKIVKHDSIIKLIDVCESEKFTYIIAELATQGDLFDYLSRRPPIDLATAIKFFRQIMSGVQYLHQHGICHRDLKLENILVDESNRLKITDFGFARWMRNGITSESCGSLDYAAPEILRGDRQYNGRAADIWSCGVILFVLVFREMPFDGRSRSERAAKIQRADFVLPNIDTRVSRLINRMLVWDADKRLTAAEIMNHPALAIGLPDSDRSTSQLHPQPTSQQQSQCQWQCETMLLPTAELIESDFINVLRDIGYSSVEEIKEELSATHQTRAKMLYEMYRLNRSDETKCSDLSQVDDSIGGWSDGQR
jgi:BR serine/threonine kinase